MSLALAVALLAAQSPQQQPAPAPSPPREVRTIVASSRFARAQAALRDDHARFVDELVQLTQIPAPPFGEGPRGKAFAAMLRQSGLPEPTIDAIGNVVALRRGSRPDLPPLIVAAHLDTVFPAGTDVTVRREGNRLMAPGISDDTRSLALVLSMVRAMDRAEIRTTRDILFVGNVGEEGQGDLRGIRHFFANEPRAASAVGFITLDLSGSDQIVTRGVGSRRYRIVFDGPGGHSFGRFGIVNPMAALARTVTGLYTVPVPRAPRTTYAASVVGGGTSVNTIPSRVFLEVDIRSEAPAEIDRIDRALHAIATAAADEENRSRSIEDGRITVAFETIGDRPAGQTPATAPLVLLAMGASRAFGHVPTLAPLSTDANIPMSLGIPAIAIGSGGAGGGHHAPSEWTDVSPEDAARGGAVALATILAAAGMER